MSIFLHTDVVAADGVWGTGEDGLHFAAKTFWRCVWVSDGDQLFTNAVSLWYALEEATEECWSAADDWEYVLNEDEE